MLNGFLKLFGAKSQAKARQVDDVFQLQPPSAIEVPGSAALQFAFSGGMHIEAGCSHFATFLAELRTIEPVIAHEMTHGCLAHLSARLNEGLAVSTERRLCPPLAQQYTAQQLYWEDQPERGAF